MYFTWRMAALLLMTVGTALADEIKIDSPIESVAMFKNGLALVRRSATLNGAGVYRIDDAPAAVHGTFWVEGDIPVDVQATLRDVEVPAGVPGDPQSELVGRNVTITLKQSGLAQASGRVAALFHPKGETGITGASFLVLETAGGRVYIDMSEIALMNVDGAAKTVHQRRGVLLLTSAGNAKGMIHITYLTKGIAWAPSYRLELLDDKKLSVRQNADVKNELADLHDADLTLISGYPNIRFGQVDSLLSPMQTWAGFFQQLNAGENDMGGVTANAMAMNQAASNMRGMGAAIDLPAAPAGEPADLHYQSIGKRTLDQGDTLQVSVASGEGPYDRVVEWSIPDDRNQAGYHDQSENRGDIMRREEMNDQAWDAIRFKNPLSFAMTTGPAMIVDGGHFAGQTMSEWTSAGSEEMLHITKALTVRTRMSESEQLTEGAHTTLFSSTSNNSGKYTVTGELDIHNDRAKAISVVINRQFSGDLVKADENPTVKLRSDAPLSNNRRNEMVWNLQIKPGEERKLTYTYTLVIGE